MKDAATLAVVGVVVVMAALTILMIAIMVITRLVPGSKEAKTNATPEDIQDEELEKKSVAAIAVAMALAMEAEKRRPPLAAGWLSWRGKWPAAGHRLAESN